MELRKLQNQIVQAALEVQKNMGLGFQKPEYSQALAYELDLRKISYEREKKVKLPYKGSVAGEYALEFVVGESVIVSLKAGEPLTDTDLSRMRSLLRATKLDLGLILDFGKDTLNIKTVSK